MKDNKRLHILNDNDLEEIYGAPVFTSREKGIHFRIDQRAEEILKSFRSVKSKVIFILQLGIFKKKKRFFSITKNQYILEKKYILNKYFPDYTRTDLSLPSSSMRSQQNDILNLLGYRRCSEKEKKRATTIAKEKAGISNKKEYLFKELVNYFEKQRVILPPYYFFQKTISEAFRAEEKRILTTLKKEFQKDRSALLKELLDLSTSEKVSLLKREMSSFSFKQISKEVKKREILNSIPSVSHTIDKLKISSESIRSYADFFNYYDSYRIKRFSKEKQALFVLCFLHFKLKKINNNLVDAFIFKVNQIINEAKDHASARILELQKDNDRLIKKIPLILDFFLKEDDPAVSFEEIKSKVFALMNKEEITELSSFLKSRGFDRKNIEWTFVETKYLPIKRYLRPIIKNIKFDEVGSDKEKVLLQVITLIVDGDQDLFNTKYLSLIPKNLRKYLLANDQSVNLKRFEFFLYKIIQHKILAGDLCVTDTFNFKSFSDDLLPSEKLKEINISRKTRLPILRRKIDEILEKLSLEMDLKYKEINARLNENEHLKIDNQEWHLKYEGKKDHKRVDLFSDSAQIRIDDILRIIDSKTSFTSSFKHEINRATHIKPDVELILAAILGHGTTLGLYRISQTSNVEYKSLLYVSQNYLSIENLKNANTKILENLKNMPVFNFLSIDWEGVHSSSDGQKFETQYDTLKSRYSSKYFGLNKGITDYSLVAGHVPINSKIIGANEYEGHYVFDLLYNNDTSIISKIHSTDTHGINQVNFAILDFFNYYFAPRYKRFNSNNKTFYSLNPLQEYQSMLIRPQRLINKDLITNEWENIRKIIFSLEQKETTQSIVVQKLSSYARQNSTKKALWEYNNIIRTIYYLDYIDDIVLRQNVQKALNIGEHYHQLKRVISFASLGKLRAKTEIEQELWSQSCRLIANAVIYYNALILSRNLNLSDKNTQDLLRNSSPIAWKHINFYGSYEFYKKKLTDKDILTPSVLSKEMFE